MSELTTVRRGNVCMTWDDRARLCTMLIAENSTIHTEDAVFTVDTLVGWIGTEGQPFGWLTDCRGLVGVEVGYRATLSAFLREHRHDAIVAFYHGTPFVRIAAKLFRVATGLPLEAFEAEADARAWLRTRGVEA